MAPLLFCNIAWMNEYQGHQKLDGDVDEPVNGGCENGDHECCNFLSDEDGNVYGHVETWKGYIDEDHRGKDTKIQINNLGAKGKEYVDGVDVIWSATPSEHNKRVIGWYLNATVYRERQFHKNDKFPTPQHKKDGIDSYRIVAKQENVHLIPVNERTENLIIDPHKRKIGFPGMNSVFYPINHRDNEELVNFIERLYRQTIRPDLQENTMWSDILEDINAINESPGISETTKKALIDARLGQGRFRDDLIDYWEGGCAVTRLREEDWF